VSLKKERKRIEARRNESKRYTIYKFDKKNCSTCKYNETCPIKRQKKYFSILIYDWTYELLERGEKLKENKKKRAPVESVFFILKYPLGLDRIPIRGLLKMDYWAKMKGIAFNFERIMRYMEENPPRVSEVSANNVGFTIFFIFEHFFKKISKKFLWEGLFSVKQVEFFRFLNLCFCR